MALTFHIQFCNPKISSAVSDLLYLYRRKNKVTLKGDVSRRLLYVKTVILSTPCTYVFVKTVTINRNYIGYA